jgi:hypothetical protein
MKKFNLFFALILIFCSISSYAQKAEEGVFIFDPSKKLMQKFSQFSFLTIDHPSFDGFELYGPFGLKDWLNQNQIQYKSLDLISTEYDQNYPTPEEIEKKLYEIHSKYPNITQIINVGKSVNGRNLLFIKISQNPNQDKILPEVKYISSMHGDEITGRELMIKLIEHLCANYNKDSFITSLINNTEIFIMPSMNPDGSYKKQRANAKGYDLNRVFPDFTTNDNQNTPDRRPQEVQAIMKFQAQRQFALSANFHGGSEVVNYPWDATFDPHPFTGLVKDLSLEYALRVEYMKNSNEFPNGITNGANWYVIHGGMQDWSYAYHNDLQVTIELSNEKWPKYDSMNYYYSQNQEALLYYLSAVHQGAGFYLINDNGKVLNQNGIVKIEMLNPNYKTPDSTSLWSEANIDRTSLWSKANIINLGQYYFTHGEFYKVLPKGTYRFLIKLDQSNKTYLSSEIQVKDDYKHKILNPNYVAVKIESF